MINISPEIFATGKIGEVSCDFVVFIGILIVVVATALSLDLVMVSIPTSHMKHEIDLLIRIVGEESGKFGSYVVVRGSDGWFVNDEIDSAQVGAGVIGAWRYGGWEGVGYLV